jgi:hypothetical protein
MFYKSKLFFMTKMLKKVQNQKNKCYNEIWMDYQLYRIKSNFSIYLQTCDVED